MNSATLTKQDLITAAQKFATKADLKELVKTLATKEELKKLATKDDFHQYNIHQEHLIIRLQSGIDSVLESLSESNKLQPKVEKK